jgi:hypothetical protein
VQNHILSDGFGRYQQKMARLLIVTVHTSLSIVSESPRSDAFGTPRLLQPA